MLVLHPHPTFLQYTKHTSSPLLHYIDIPTMFILIYRLVAPSTLKTKIVSAFATRAAAERAVIECQLYFEAKVWPELLERAANQHMVVVYKPEITLTLQIMEIACLYEKDNGEVLPERVLQDVFGDEDRGTIW
jgi:hypothetical protein